MSTRNLTLAIDENLLHEARVSAARRRTSVNALVRQYLADLVGEEARRRKAWESIQDLVQEPKLLTKGRLPTRESLYDR